MSQAYLILCHTPPYHIATLAKRHPNARFYVHYDAKSPINQLHFLQNLDNVSILRNRIDVHWGGFSMILATLNLFQAALSHQQNQYFHLMSGNCVPLISPEAMQQQCQKQPENSLWLESQNTPRLRYRTRFNAPHADTTWQRSLFGKGLTKGLQIADNILFSKEICLSGSQWFSASRITAQILFQEALSEPSDFFAKKLCPDEHFFQYIAAQQADKLNLIDKNHRFIRFQAGKNHPDELSLDDLWAAKNQGFWFARKVSKNNIQRFLDYETTI